MSLADDLLQVFSLLMAQYHGLASDDTRAHLNFVFILTFSTPVSMQRSIIACYCFGPCAACYGSAYSAINLTMINSYMSYLLVLHAKFAFNVICCSSGYDGVSLPFLHRKHSLVCLSVGAVGLHDWSDACCMEAATALGAALVQCKQHA